MHPIAPACALRTLASCTVALAACTFDAPPDFGTAPELGPVAVGDHLAIGDADARALVLLDVADGHHVATRRVALEGAPTLVASLPGDDHAGAALVLSRAARTLDLVSATSSARRTFHLGSPFEGLALSPDGDVAIAYHPPGTADAVFHNENEIALVDLGADSGTAAGGDAPPDAVVRRTLASLGGAPLSIHMSPRVGPRRFAFVLSEEHVAVVALDDARMPERSVPLVSLTTGGTRTPKDVAFAVDPVAGTLWAIVSTLEASSVYAIAVVPAASPDGADAADFDIHLSQLAGISPGGAAALTVLGPADARALYTLTTSPSAGSLTLTDVASATGKSLTIQPGLDRILLFSGEGGAPMALVWASAHGAMFHVVDLDKMAAGADKAFATRTARAPFSALLPIPDSARFIALHPSTDEGVSVIDAATSRVTGFGKTGSVGALMLSPELGRLFVLTHLGEDTFVVAVDLASLHPEVALAPDGADALALLPGVATVAALGHLPGGHVTLWPALATADDTTEVVSGFLLDHLFQR